MTAKLNQRKFISRTLTVAARGNSGHAGNAGAFYGFRCVKDIQ